MVSIGDKIRLYPNPISQVGGSSGLTSSADLSSRLGMLFNILDTVSNAVAAPLPVVGKVEGGSRAG